MAIWHTKAGQPEIVPKFMHWLEQRNPGETEFHQAVYEVGINVLPYLIEHPEYMDAAIFGRLTEPDRIISFRIVWENDAGEVQINRGYRVQHCNAIGPYKGGIRFHPSVNQSILKFLAFEQTFKNSLTGLPMGGGKGGADFDPKGKSDSEVMRFCHAFMTELYRYIGPHTDVPAGDIGVGGREISYMFGQYKRLKNEFTGVMTGKGLAFGGSEIRVEATGYGCVYMMEDMLGQRGQNLEGKTAVISGSGNVAQYAADKLIELGAKPVTLSDSSGFIYDPDGIDGEKLAYVKELKNIRRGRIAEYAEEFGVEYYAGKRPWQVPCDIAFPCATQNELNVEEANSLLKNGCIGVSEGANMPSEQDAIDVFQAARILFAPSKAANAGGVAVSGLEMTQNSIRMSWSREELNTKLRNIMSDIHDRCEKYGRESDDYVNYLKGANIAGFVKVADAMLAYGVM
ncbi:MAG: NADP-specific glutamate dehydrogenase [Gammaproteobacteria bacterium]|nr:MAG: NADP-specific glutamate dehydrogenase [Gammaproteobacteria bacterium]